MERCFAAVGRFPPRFLASIGLVDDEMGARDTVCLDYSTSYRHFNISLAVFFVTALVAIVSLPVKSDATKSGDSTAPSPALRIGALPDLYRVTNNTSGRAHCGGVVPLNGTFNASAPPFYFPSPQLCPIPRLFTQESYMHCMRDRGGNVYHMGNSFSRGFAFAQQQMLINSPLKVSDFSAGVNRQAQKKLCEKAAHSNNDDQSCSLGIPIPESLRGEISEDQAKIYFLWRAHHWATDMQTDFCSGRTPVDCYRHYFKGESKPGDVLISNIGLSYVEYWRGHGQWGPNKIIEAVKDLTAFLDSGVFKGTFIWTSVSTAHPLKNYGGYNADMEAINAAFVPVLQARNVSIIYQQSFKQGLSDEEAFVDSIHPPVSHYMAVMYHAMAVVCDGYHARRDSMRS